MEKLAAKYKEKVDFLFVYCREAHPQGDPRFETKTKKNEPIPQPKTPEERKRIAQRFCEDMKMTRRILVDEFEPRSVQRLYGGRPNPTIVIDRAGVVALKMAWTQGEALDRFLEPFLAQGGTFNADLAARVPMGGPVIPKKK